MSEGLNARTRIMAIIEILTMYTDEFNTMTIEQLCQKLTEYGYTVTKRAVLDDIKVIKQSPVEIIKVSNEEGFYLLKSHFQSAIRKIFTAAYSSPLLSNDAVSEIIKYLRRNACLPTLDLMEETTERVDFNNHAAAYSIDLSQTVRSAIHNKKRVEIFYTRITPGDSYSAPNTVESIVINPLKLAVMTRTIALIFTRPSSPDKSEFINLNRIRSAKITDEDADEFTDTEQIATNYFNGRQLIPDYKKHTWMLLKLKEEDIETIDYFFSTPVQYKKADEEGYCLVKVYTLIDESVLGALFHLYNRLEILAPESLKSYFNSYFKTLKQEEVI
ncbi:MAG: WYL domain-containing protein [Clostridia bacterium]|nr:WYL domain-containing protein [Clostridia bacterium]